MRMSLVTLWARYRRCEIQWRVVRIVDVQNKEGEECTSFYCTLASYFSSSSVGDSCGVHDREEAEG